MYSGASFAHLNPAGGAPPSRTRITPMNVLQRAAGVRLWIAAAACVALASLVGCGGSNKATVPGNVTHPGAPPPRGPLVLSAPAGRSAVVYIKPDGTFDMSDVPVGQMNVAINTNNAGGRPVPGGSTQTYASAPHVSAAIPQRYRNPSSSGLTWDVKPGVNSRT